MKIESSNGESWEFIKGSTGHYTTQLILKRDNKANIATLQNTIDDDNINFDASDMLDFLLKHIDPQQRERIARGYIADNPNIIAQTVQSWSDCETYKDKAYREKSNRDECLIYQLARDLSKKKKEFYKDCLYKRAKKARLLPDGFIESIFEDKK